MIAATTAIPQSDSGERKARNGLLSVGSFTFYEDAQAAVDRLSDAGFPVESVQIVGNDIRTVETVLGRLTKGRATLNGAAGGAWFGLLVALLIGVFSVGAIWLAVILTGMLFGAAFGAVLGFAQHWSTRGKRDFSSVRSLSASRYDVFVQDDRFDDALRILQSQRVDAPTAQPNAVVVY